MSHEAKFEDDDLIVSVDGETAVVVHAEPDDRGWILINLTENPDTEKKWCLTGCLERWTKVEDQ